MATPTLMASTFRVSPSRLAQSCGGVVKPDVVFFGENVPRDRFEARRARSGAGRRRPDRRFVADALFGLPLCRNGGARSASRLRRSILAGPAPMACLRSKSDQPCETALAFLL